MIINISKYLFFLMLLFNTPHLYAAQVNDDVVQAINEQGIAHVIINLDVSFDFEPSEEEVEQARRLRSLKAIEPRPELSKSEKLQRIAEAIAPVQEEVLAAVAHLDESQFKLSTQYTLIAALVADIGQEALTILRQHPKVTLIQLDAIGSASLTTRIPLINANQVHSLSPTSYTGEGVAVAVLDSGIDTNHTDFSDSAIIDEKCFVNAGCSPSNADEGNSAEDDYGHGTHVSGIITSPNGVAPNSDIVAVKVIDHVGDFQLGDLMSGVGWILENLDTISPEIRVMNMSLGLTDRFDDASKCDTAYPSFTAVFNQLANEFDVVIFAAAGNNNDPDEIDWPSCLSNIIAVGNSTDGNTLHSSGNKGALVDIVAPGVGIDSTQMGGGSVEDTGTSMSSPMAAGVATLLLEKDPSLTPALIKQKLFDTGVSIIDNSITYKRIDALAAVQDTTTQAILKLTQNSVPYLNDATYDLGVFNQNANISKQFKLFNLGNEASITSNFNLTGDTINLEGTFPTNIAANSSDIFTLSFPTDTEGSYSGAINFDYSNDPNNTNFTTNLNWRVCDGVLPLTDDFASSTGCWVREIINNPTNPDPNSDHNKLYKPLIECIENECLNPELIAYKDYNSQKSLWFYSSYLVDYGGSSAQAQLTSPAFSTVGNKNIDIDFDFYERNGTGDDDKMTVQWSTDGENWQYINEFNCQTGSSGWQARNVTLPSEAENETTIYINFLFDADGNNSGVDEDCFLANVKIEADKAPEIALYGNNVEIINPDTTPDTIDGTDFGSVEIGSILEATFTIKNQGLENLNLTGSPLVALSGVNADQFLITQPSNSVIAANSSQTFKVSFKPTQEGTQNGTIRIKNNDTDEDVYTFLIKGNGEKSKPIYLPPPEPDYVGVFIGSPNGRVVSEPEGIDCDHGKGSCWHVFPRIDPETGSITRLTLNTIAPEGLYFDSWMGDSDCNDSKLYLNNSKGCLAYFYGIRGYQAPDIPDIVDVKVEKVASFSEIAFTGLINESNNILSRFDLSDKQTLLISAIANDTQADPALSLEQTRIETLIAQNDNWTQAINRTALEQVIELPIENSAALLQSLDADSYSLAMTAVQSGLATLSIQPQNDQIDKRSLSYISTRLLFTDVADTKVNFTLQNVVNNQLVLIKVWGATPDIDPSMRLTFNNRVLDSNDNWQQHSRANEIPESQQPKSINDAALLVNLSNASYGLSLNTANNISGLMVIEIQLLNDE